MAGTDACGFTVKRTCDICGVSLEAKPGVFRMIKGRLVCHRHDHYVPVEVADAAPRRRFRIEPLKNARPFNPRDTYESAEWEILNFLTDNYRNEGVDFTSDGGAGPVAAVSKARGPGWTGVYLYELITEAKRPHRMVAAARALLATVADYLLTLQYAGPHRPGAITDADARWGGFEDTGATSGNGTLWTTRDTAVAGLALLRAYQVHGTAAYLGAARAAIWYLRGAQCGGKVSAAYSSTDVGALVRWDSGTWPTSTLFSGATPAPSHNFAVGELVALEFYAAFLAAVGDETVGSAAVGPYASSRAALLSVAIAEAKAFWLTTGALDANLGAGTLGLSTTRPFDFFNAWANAKIGVPAATGTWEYTDGNQAAGTLIDGLGWALGIRALHKVDGASAFVTSRFDWLMGFTSNPTFELPASRSIALELAAAKGTYAPSTALATSLQVRSAGANVTTNGTSFYSLAAAGALGALYSSRQQPGFKALKDSLNVKRYRRNGAGPTHHLGPMGVCGLTLQPRSSATQRRSTTYLAALTGLIYRHAPQAWTGRGPS
jgi:hypothetical protein